MRVSGQAGQKVCYHDQQPRNMRQEFPQRQGSQSFDSTVLVSSKTGEDIVRSSTARYRPERSVSVSGSYTVTSHFTGRPERPEYG